MKYICNLCHTIVEESEYSKNPSINRIIEKCINCGICTKTCNKVTGLNLDKNIHECVNCGNCLTMCPTGALCPVYNYRKVMNIINKKENVLVAFTAPAVRTSLGECFNMDAGQNTEGKMVTALKNIGFNYIYGDIAEKTGYGRTNEQIKNKEKFTNVYKLLSSMGKICRNETS